MLTFTPVEENLVAIPAKNRTEANMTVSSR
jgi:hypothetical protein